MAHTRIIRRTESRIVSNQKLIERVSISKIRGVAAALNKVLGSGAVHVGSSGRGMPRYFVPSQSDEINELIGGRGGMGYPVGRIIECFGGEQCLPADTLLFTECGLLTVDELFTSQGFKATCVSRKEKASVGLLNRYGKKEETELFVWNRDRSVWEIATEDGAAIKSTANHPHLVLDKAGFLSWRQTSKIQIGDYLVRSNGGMFGKKIMEADVAYLLGVLVADGYFGKNKIAVTNNNEVIIDYLRHVCSKELSVDPKEYRTRGASIDFQFSSKEKVRRFYLKYGFKPGVAADKEVPLSIRQGNRSVVKNFLAGYFDCEGSFSKGNIVAVSASHKLLQQIKLLLQCFGFHSTISRQPSPKNYKHKNYWRIILSGANAVRYLREIGTKARSWKRSKAATSTGKKLPEHVFPLVKSLYDATETTRIHHTYLKDWLSSKTRSAGALHRALISCDWGNSQLRDHLLDLCELKFVRVKSKHKKGSEPTFDFKMPKTHSFVAEGYITHNTVKTGLGYDLLASVQKMGGIAVVLPTEGNVDEWLAERYGVNTDEWLTPPVETLEAVDRTILSTLKRVGKRQLVAFLWDSVAGTSTEAELKEKELTQTVSAMLRAQLMSKMFRRFGARFPSYDAILFCINQVRENPNAMFGEKTKPPGGKALPFYAALRLKLTMTGQVKRKHAGKEQTVAFKIKIKTMKNRVSPPFQETEVLCHFEHGIIPVPTKKKTALQKAAAKKRKR